jgi:hypothetical protein
MIADRNVPFGEYLKLFASDGLLSSNLYKAMGAEYWSSLFISENPTFELKANCWLGIGNFSLAKLHLAAKISRLCPCYPKWR